MLPAPAHGRCTSTGTDTTAIPSQFQGAQNQGQHERRGKMQLRRTRASSRALVVNGRARVMMMTAAVIVNRCSVDRKREAVKIAGWVIESRIPGESQMEDISMFLFKCPQGLGCFVSCVDNGVLGCMQGTQHACKQAQTDPQKKMHFGPGTPGKPVAASQSVRQTQRGQARPSQLRKSSKLEWKQKKSGGV